MSFIDATAGPSAQCTPTHLAAAVVHDSAASITAPQISPFDASFGYTLSQTSTRQSQHDRRLSSSSFTADPEMPPAYVEPPAYEVRQTEPATLAMFLFKFGFLFFPFWIMGSLILLTPLRAPECPSDSSLPASWLPEKTPAEREHIISKMRAVEVKWARRCLTALAIFVLVTVAIVVTTWGILKVTQGF